MVRGLLFFSRVQGEKVLHLGRDFSAALSSFSGWISGLSKDRPYTVLSNQQLAIMARLMLNSNQQTSSS